MASSNAFTVQDVAFRTVTARQSPEGLRVEVGEGWDGQPIMEVTFPVVDGVPAVRVRSRNWLLSSVSGAGDGLGIRPLTGRG